MTLAIVHPFHSSKSDGSDSTLVQPSNWNANHTITMASGFVVGRKTAGTGAAEELSGTDIAAMLPAGTTIPSGTIMLFQQTSAPTGWTKIVTSNDAALRVVSGTVGSGGTKAFSTLFAAGTLTGSHVLSATEIPSHTHTFSGSTSNAGGHSHSYGAGGGTTSRSSSGSTCVADCSSGSTSSVGDHSHSFSGTTAAAGSGGGHTHTMALDVNYVDVIFASKN